MATLQPPAPPLATSTSPKRKRDQLSLDSRPHTPTLQYPKSNFSFELPTKDGEDGNSSPRSKVARKFQGLALGVVTADSEAETWESSSKALNPDSISGAKPSASHSSSCSKDMHYVPVGEQADDGSAMRKRLKLPDATGNTPRKHDTTLTGTSQIHTTSVFAPGLDKSPENEVNTLSKGFSTTDTAKNPGSSSAEASLKKANTDISVSHKSSAGKGRRQRVGTPPLVAAKTSADGSATEDSEVDIVDPVRAALTWHEDEITVYDPNDEDDDGVGINGIGFRPTPAIAHARSMKRRQQLAEYKKREEREARARRTLRRRTSPKTGSEAAKVPDGDAKLTQSAGPSARRVHFMEFEPTVVITT